MTKIPVWLFLLTLLLVSTAGHAETMIKEEFGCLHLARLEQFDRLSRMGQRVTEFMVNQLKSGECSMFQLGTLVRLGMRTKTDVCIVPYGSSEPCRWTSSESVK